MAAAVMGVDAYTVEVEVDISSGDSYFAIVDCPMPP